VESLDYVKFEVLLAVTTRVKNIISWYVTPCSLVYSVPWSHWVM
jgi:hypothetical protein